MFFVYGTSGPIFQGTLENLGRIPPVTRTGPVVAARRIGDQVEKEQFPLESAAIKTSPQGEQAVEAYQAMLPGSLERGPLYHANQIMQHEVITVLADSDVAHAWQILAEYEIHQAPVLDAEGQLVGIVSERNLLTTLNVDAGKVRDVMDRRVSDVMTTPVVAASPITDIRRIARVMIDRNTEGVPIVNETGTLVGFISRSDILRAVVTEPPLSVWR